MPFGFHPDSDKRPLLPEGQYGLGGEAELTRIALRPVPGEKNAGLYYLSLNVQIDDPAQGRVFADTQPFGPFNTQTGAGAGSIGKTLLANLGLDPMATQFAEEADDKNNYALLGPNPAPCKVVVELAVDENKKTGDKRNVIKGIARLA